MIKTTIVVICGAAFVLFGGLTACDKGAGASREKNAAGAAKQGETGGRGSGGGGARKFPVKTQPVGTRDVNYALTVFGRLVEENEYRVPARVAGTIEGVNFREGDRVTSGQEIGRIDYERYKLLVEKARNELLEKESAVERAKAEYLDKQRETSTTIESTQTDFELAEADYKRRSELKSGYVSAEERQQYESKYKKAAVAFRDAVAAARTQLALAQAAVNEEETALAAAKASLAIAQDDLDRAILRAPISGVINERLVTNGEYVTPGKEVAVMVQTDPLRLRFTVPESKAANLTEAMKVKFSVPAFPDRTFEADVYDIGVVADPDVNEIVCWASVDNNEGILRPGYFSKVNMSIASRKQAIVVPLGAVMPTEAGMVSYVVQDEIAVRKKIQTGMQVNGDAIEILGGLEPGEQLVVEGGDSLQDNVPVRVVNETKSADASASTVSADIKSMGADESFPSEKTVVAQNITSSTVEGKARQ